MGGAQGSVRVWDVASSSQVALFEAGREALTCLVLSPSHDLLLTAGPTDGSVRMWR